MKQLTHEINLNMTQPNNFEYVYAMQSDYDSEIVVATLYDGNTLYTIDANQAVLNGVTENGNTIVYNNVTIDSDKHRISFPLTKEMLFESGDTRFVVSFFDTRNNQRKSAFPFIIKSVSDAEGTLPVSVLKKISEYVAEAAASAQEAKESAKNAKDSEDNAKTSEINAKSSEDNAKKYATEAKSYAIGGTGTRKNEDIQNTQYYYNVIKELFDNHLEQILYYTDYASFEKDYNDEKITAKTLVLIAEGGESDDGNSTNPYCVNIILAENMTWVDTSGNLKQYVKGTKTIDEVIIRANSGYYFPEDYTVESVNGIVVTRNSESQITISGSPTKNTEITLVAPSESKSEDTKGEQSAPTGLTDGVGKINGTTTAMEYSSDNITWRDCSDGSTVVDAGTYYVRYKETDKLKASPSTTVEVSENEDTGIPEAITDLKVVYNTETKLYDISFTYPKNTSSVKIFTTLNYYESEDGTAYLSYNANNTPIATLAYPEDTCSKDYSNLYSGDYAGLYIYAFAFNDKGEVSKHSNVVTWVDGTRIGGFNLNNPQKSKIIYLFKEGDTCNNITNGWVCDNPSMGGITSKYMYIKPTPDCSSQTICLYTQTGKIPGTGYWQTDQKDWLIRSYLPKFKSAKLYVEYSSYSNVRFISALSEPSTTDSYVTVGTYYCYQDSRLETTSPKISTKNISDYYFDIRGVKNSDGGKYFVKVTTPITDYWSVRDGSDLAIVCNLGDLPTDADIELRIHNVYLIVEEVESDS